MGWFDEQIKLRIQNDGDALRDAYAQMAGAVTGKKISAALSGGDQTAKDAIHEILSYYGIKPQELPSRLRDLNEQLEYLMRPSGIMRRTVLLPPDWFKDAIGPMLATRSDTNSPVALIPTGFAGYSFTDAAAGKQIRLNHKNQHLIDKEAICFYKPLPLKPLDLPGLMRCAANTLSAADLLPVLLAVLTVTLVGMLGPALNNLLFSSVISSGNLRLLWAVSAFLVSASIAALLLSTVKKLLLSRINTKLTLSIQAAAMMRVLSLPASFFKRFSAGELSNRVQQLGPLCGALANAALSAGLTAAFSLTYLIQALRYAPALAAPALAATFATALLSLLSAMAQARVSQRQMELSAKESGLCYSLISGIQKIRLAGAEKRAFAKWAAQYAQAARLRYDPPLFLKLNSVISTAISLTAAIAIYCAAMGNQVDTADYYAFSAAYGMVSGAFLSLSGMALTMARIKPVYELVRPILQAVPEISAGKKVVTRLSGAIELNNVSFRYSENSPLVADGLSLKIRPGQYVAIVGQTGCGKSTLMRLMLGFETPQKGAVYYDGRDLAQMDLRSLRRNIGVVMQDGRLFQGDIFSNITISAPWLTLDDAWRAAELSGIADDIRRMPMGMNTLVSEGSGGISGGQRQRLLIARAIAPRPRVLMFDEATSALDNLTQKTVSEALDSLKCTRIVIAHRLSTIRRCDRIVVLDKGKIIEDGSYDELLEKQGFFAQLVARQRLDGPAGE